MGCCQGSKSYREGPDMMHSISTMTVGKCVYKQSFTEKGVPVKGSALPVTRIGEFTGICTLNSDECGSPTCDGMTITIQGDSYFFPKVAFEDPIARPIRSPGCLAIFGGDCQNPPAARLAGFSEYDEPEYNYHAPYPYHEEHQGYDDDDERNYRDDAAKAYRTGPGIAFIGTFYVTSRTHGTDFNTGIYELVELVGALSNSTLTSVPDDALPAKGSAVILKFLKTEDSDKA